MNEDHLEHIFDETYKREPDFVCNEFNWYKHKTLTSYVQRKPTKGKRRLKMGVFTVHDTKNNTKELVLINDKQEILYACKSVEKMAFQIDIIRLLKLRKS